MDAVALANSIVAYLHALDAALELLSRHAEGHVAALPDWVLRPRHVIVGIHQLGGVVVKVVPDTSLETDRIEIRKLVTRNDVSDVLGGWSFQGGLAVLATRPFTIFSGLQIEEQGQPLAPVVTEPGLFGMGAFASALGSFRLERAHREAVDFWGRAKLGTPGSGSVVHELQKVFSTFHAIVKRKAWLERRIHRYLNQHRNALLPEHATCYFEVPLKLGDDMRKADFVLCRSDGEPALLVELENPTHKIFRKDGHMTEAVNHARSQIAEWVKFIDSEPQTNAVGEFSFLVGPKRRLVVIGRGIDCRDRLLDTRFTDTVVWTYDLLLDQAKQRWAKQLNSARQLIGLPRLSLFGVSGTSDSAI